MSERHMVFDVESVGLHGEGFAVAWVVIEKKEGRWERVREGWVVCPPGRARGTPEGRKWVKENAAFVNEIEGAMHLPAPNRSVNHTAGVRKAFWEVWTEEAVKGSLLWADVGWPVEARFLIACVEDDRECPDDRGPANDLGKTGREWKGPYPLHEIETLRVSLGVPPEEDRFKDPRLADERLADELPIHHPLADARHSARLLGEALGMICEARP